MAAGQGASPDARQALEALCRLYWYPLYAFVRRLGHQSDDAQDLTQAFFTRLLEKDCIQAADPNRGRFRSFLLASFKHFIADERDRAGAEKRGGGKVFLPLDFAAGERRYHLEPAHDWTAERIYERRWAMTLLDQVLERLRREFEESGKATIFNRLKGFLTGEGAPHRQVAAELDMAEGAVKVAVHRLRSRYRKLVLAEIGRTVVEPGETDEELRHLFAAISPPKSEKSL